MKEASDIRHLRAALGAGAFCLALTALPGCQSHPHTSAQRESMKDDLAGETEQTLDRLYAVKPGARRAIESSAGYAVFTDFDARLLVVGTGRGRGIAVDNTDGGSAFMRMVEVTAGVGPGAKKFSLVLVFASRERFLDFVAHGWQAQTALTGAAKAGEVGGALEGAWAIAPGIEVYQLTDTGLAAELSVKAMKFYPDKGLQ
jgi:lipid-binding SYLF domain-containing protein